MACLGLLDTRPYLMVLEVSQGTQLKHWIYHTEAPAKVLEAQTQNNACAEGLGLCAQRC